MKKIHKTILENQLAIMEALHYLMMPQKPREKEYIYNEVARTIESRRRITGMLISRDNYEKATGRKEKTSWETHKRQ